MSGSSQNGKQLRSLTDLQVQPCFLRTWHVADRVAEIRIGDGACFVGSVARTVGHVEGWPTRECHLLWSSRVSARIQNWLQPFTIPGLVKF